MVDQAVLAQTLIHADAVIIHMNGWVYEPRFLQVSLAIQFLDGF